MIKSRRISFIGFCLCLITIISIARADAFYLDKERTFQLTGEFQTRASIRTEDSQGFTFPEVASGNLVQHRNMFYIEAHHDLRKIAWPGDFKVKYHLRGRFLYEGVYDYGPSVFKDLPNENYLEDIDDFKWDADLWEGYADISNGPFFLRLGRQNLSWGETDVFRLLDNINPLDNTFGGIFEDLDDRRIPLIMARSSYNLGKLGPIDSFTLEGFWVPGSIENEVSPFTPPGTVYALPLVPVSFNNVPGVASFYERMREPEDEMSNSRWGFRVQGIIGSNLTVALAHYKAFLDDPIANFVVDRQFNPMTMTPADIALEFTYPDVKISGASMNYYEGNTDMVIRSEIAWLEDVPVFIPEINAPGPTFIPTGLPAPFPPAFPQFNNGEIPEKNQLRFAFALDKDIWVRAINPFGAFGCTFQYTLQYTDDHDDRMRLPMPDPATGGFTLTVKEIEQTYTVVITNFSGWKNGNILPQFVCAYDPRGAWLIQPQVEYKFDPFRVKIQYSAIEGNFVSFGVLKDRDQVSLMLSWLF
jgi:uncharacterized protein DUF1302